MPHCVQDEAAGYVGYITSIPIIPACSRLVKVISHDNTSNIHDPILSIEICRGIIETY